MVTKVKKNTFGSYYWAAVIMLMALVSVTPILERPICIIIVTGLFGLAFFLNIGSKVYRDNLRLIICVLLYYFLIILYRLFDISDASWGNYMTQVFSLNTSVSKLTSSPSIQYAITVTSIAQPVAHSPKIGQHWTLLQRSCQTF